MSTRRHWTAFFAASLFVAACGGGGGGSGGGGGVLPPPPPPPPPPPNPAVIQISEITDAGTDRIVGLALDSLMAFASLGVLMERFGPELQRYVAVHGIVPGPGIGFTGLQSYTCVQPHQIGANSYSEILTNYVDTNVKERIDSGDTLDVDYHNCGDFGLQGWNADNRMQFWAFQLAGDPLGNGDWAVKSPPDGTGLRWTGIMQSVKYDQPPTFDSVQSFYISIGGSVERRAADLITSIESRSNLVPSQLLAYRGPSPSTATTAIGLDGRYLPVLPNSPLVTVLDALGRRTMNGSAVGQFDIQSARLSWFQSSRLSIGLDAQPARVSLSNIQFASLSQIDSRRAETGSMTIAPTERTGFSIRVDVIDSIWLRIRVLDANSFTVSDRTARWDDVIWNYWTAIQ